MDGLEAALAALGETAQAIAADPERQEQAERLHEHIEEAQRRAAQRERDKPVKRRRRKSLRGNRAKNGRSNAQAKPTNNGIKKANSIWQPYKD